MARALDLEKIVQRRAELLGPFGLRPRARERETSGVAAREKPRREGAATRQETRALGSKARRAGRAQARARTGEQTWDAARARACDARSARERGYSRRPRQGARAPFTKRAAASAAHSHTVVIAPPVAARSQASRQARAAGGSAQSGRGPALAEGGRRRRARRWRRRREQLEHLGRFIRLAALRWRARCGSGAGSRRTRAKAGSRRARLPGRRTRGSGDTRHPPAGRRRARAPPRRA